MSKVSSIASAVIGLFLIAAPQHGARADTLSEALARAYVGNPQLRAQRADTRATDENLPNALAGYHPTANAGVDGGLLRELYATPGANGGNKTYVSHPAGGTIQVTQNLFNGFRTQNQVRLAQAQILSSRDTLQYTELSVLASAAGAYMDVLRDTAIVALRKSNVTVLEQQLADTRLRLKDGEVTRTDVAQAEAALSQGRVDLTTAMTTLKGSAANYEQVIGVAPKSLSPAKPPVALLPHNIDEAFQISDAEHPLNLASRHNVEVAEHAVKIAEGQLLPTLNVTASSSPNYNYASIEREKYYNSSVTAQLNVPLYDGGSNYSQIRQAKEKLGQAQALADQQRVQVRASTAASFAAWENSHKIIADARKEERQNEAALAGVREEARLGQRTTFDVLYAQQSLLNARILFVTAQHDQIISSFSLLAATGRLSAQTLGLDAPRYDPTEHYDRVKDKWFGTNP